MAAMLKIRLMLLISSYFAKQYRDKFTDRFKMWVWIEENITARETRLCHNTRHFESYFKVYYLAITMSLERVQW